MEDERRLHAHDIDRFETTKAYQESVLRWIAIAVLLVVTQGGRAAAESGTTSAAAKKAIADSISAALQGDGVRARAALVAVPAEQFSKDDVPYRACMIERFSDQPHPLPAANTDDAFVREVLQMYQEYWRRALMNPSQRDALAADLRRKLSAFLGEGAVVRDWDALESRLSERLKDRAHHSQLGYTPPLRELMIWRKRDSEVHSIELPEGAHHITVEKLDDFVSLGWSSYARCGRGSNGGWVGEDRIFAVMPAFANEAGEDAFRASLLAHETQHFADLERFGELENWRLEYRAKLTELWAAGESLNKLLTKFAASQSDDKDSPHTYANKRVLIALRERLRVKRIESSAPNLEDAPVDDIREAARAELIEDSRRLAAAKKR